MRRTYDDSVPSESYAHCIRQIYHITKLVENFDIERQHSLDKLFRDYIDEPADVRHEEYVKWQHYVDDLISGTMDAIRIVANERFSE